MSLPFGQAPANAPVDSRYRDNGGASSAGQYPSSTIILDNPSYQTLAEASTIVYPDSNGMATVWASGYMEFSVPLDAAGEGGMECWIAVEEAEVNGSRVRAYANRNDYLGMAISGYRNLTGIGVGGQVVVAKLRCVAYNTATPPFEHRPVNWSQIALCQI